MKKRGKKTCPLGGSSPCAYCHLHKCTITPRQMKNRECLKKHCTHLVPWKQHGIWAERARTKEARTKRKQNIEQTVRMIREGTDGTGI